MAAQAPQERVRFALSRQEWHDVCFLHWPVEAAALRPLVPPELDIDLFAGAAWLTVTPLVMRRVRGAILPRPLVRDFVEINVRTYARAADGSDGVWFLSLDCDRPSVVTAMRAIGLPYVRAAVSTRRRAGGLEFRSSRPVGGGELSVGVVPGAALERPDPLDVFLTGRWNAFMSRWGRIWRVPVEHEPWPLHLGSARAQVAGLLAADDVALPPGDPLVHTAPLVHARIGAPRPVPRPRGATTVDARPARPRPQR